ncbi:hypothetical protein Ancab_024628 [Ancistrocladus abbreviatus]
MIIDYQQINTESQNLWIPTISSKNHEPGCLTRKMEKGGIAQSSQIANVEARNIQNRRDKQLAP